MIKLYAARDSNGRLWFFANRPSKEEHEWRVSKGDYWLQHSSLLPNVRWQDEKPTEITLKIVEE